MAQALYRRWRPQTWDEVAGQEHVVQTLRNAVRSGHIAHAYLFAGPRGTGKTTMARVLAKAINCTASALEDHPCNQCEECIAVNEGRYLDLIEIDAASNTSVDDVRDLRDKINFAPNRGRFKVYIVDEVHMLSTAAFNALLKTLEEPPAHAIFILATTEVHRIPATVLSRCQRHEFRRLPVATIAAFLQQKCATEGLEVEPQALDLICRQATGSMRDAISLLDQLASTGEAVGLARAQAVLGTVSAEAVRGVVQALVDGQVGDGLTRINQALDGGADPRQFARQVVEHLRGLLLVRMGNASLVDAVQEVRAEMASQAERLEVPRLLAAIQAFHRAAADNRTTWQPGLPLELAFVEAAGELTKREDPAGSVGARAQSTPVAPPAAKPGGEPPRAPKAKTAAPALSASAPSTAGPTFDALRTAWRDILAAAKRRDPQTQALLNSGRPLGVERGVLVLGFASDLLRERMEKRDNLTLVRQSLEEVLGQAMPVRCVLLKAWSAEDSDGDPPSAVEDGGMVATAMRDLGGQVVDVKPVPPEGAP